MLESFLYKLKSVYCEPSEPSLLRAECSPFERIFRENQQTKSNLTKA